MEWIVHYQLFLFDFDGLLVDTERLHYQAYLEMCSRRGYQLGWDFTRFSQAAYDGPTDLRDQIYDDLPGLRAQVPDWRILYEEKKRCFLDLIHHQPVPLMPGVEPLLLALQKAQIARCVVTHSAASLVQHIRKQNPILDTIPHWVTREDYLQPKPDPSCYQMAINRLAHPKASVIGFEDSPKGLRALIGTQAKPVLICPPNCPYLPATLEAFPSVHYYPSFTVIDI